MRRIAAELLDWLAGAADAAPRTRRSAGRSSTPACRPNGRSPRPSAARARSNVRSRADAPGFLGEMYGDEPDRWSPGAHGRGAPALHRQLPDTPALRRPQGPARACAQGHDRGCAARRDALVPSPGARDPRATPSSSATGRRSAISPNRGCSASTRVASGAARSRRSGSIVRKQPVRLPAARAPARQRLISRSRAAAVVHRLDAGQDLESQVDPVADQLVRNAVDVALHVDRVRNFGMTRSRKISTSSQSPMSRPFGELRLIATGFQTPSTGSPGSLSPCFGIVGA